MKLTLSYPFSRRLSTVTRGKNREKPEESSPPGTIFRRPAEVDQMDTAGPLIRLTFVRHLPPRGKALGCAGPVAFPLGGAARERRRWRKQYPQGACRIRKAAKLPTAAQRPQRLGSGTSDGHGRDQRDIAATRTGVTRSVTDEGNWYGFAVDFLFRQLDARGIQGERPYWPERLSITSATVRSTDTQRHRNTSSVPAKM